ncbi:PA14 domain-containing protein [Cytophagales bacterium LB-30]|uniref:non-specific serine/threonine protein kinase n=1 Tax=Shiella aurantiaca TaxID=3058365 RepID=A0ABT8F5Q8_9BACT|nr:PA14 domain-containing protein [Shiella aurantiaca]MDN4165790.1 PA14 domain-containing protein [Shiella aurantiaca]
MKRFSLLIIATLFTSIVVQAQDRSSDSLALQQIYEALNGKQWDMQVWDTNLRTESLNIEIFDNITGARVADLTSHASYPYGYNYSSLIDSVNILNNLGDRDNYGIRIRGRLIPPETGDYYFYIAGGSEAQLWLNPNGANRNDHVKIAENTSIVGYQNYTTQASQKSSAQFLNANNFYNFEIIMKAQAGDDYLSVGWRKPSDGDGATPAEYVPSRMFQAVKWPEHDASIDEYPGVFLENGRVSRLLITEPSYGLPNNESVNAKTPIVDAVGMLTGLKQFRITSFGYPYNLNDLIDQLPSALEDLEIAWINATSEFPQDIARFSSLQRLSFLGNNMKGNIPASITQMTSLQYLAIGYNLMGGFFPQQGWENMAALMGLDVLAMPISGQIPVGLLQTPLTNLNIGQTNICVPQSTEMTTWIAGLNYFGSSEVNCSETGVSVAIAPNNKSYIQWQDTNVDIVRLGFYSPGSPTLNSLVINSSADFNFTNFRVFRSVDNSIATTADNEELTEAVISLTNSSMELSNLNFTIGNQPRYLFVVADYNKNPYYSCYDRGYHALPPTNLFLSGGEVLNTRNLEWFNDGETNDIITLKKMYTQLNGDNWTNHTNWMSDKPISEWYGVSAPDGCLRELNLSNNNLIGELGSSLLFPQARKINLSNNAIADRLDVLFPYEISYNLEELNLSNNQLQGVIPFYSFGHEGDNQYLKKLDFSNNPDLETYVHSEGQRFSILETLNVSNTQFDKTTLANVSGIPSLQSLGLSGLGLTNADLAPIAELTNLKEIHLANNVLTEFPEEIIALEEIEWIDLSHNTMKGEPALDFSQWPAITHFDISNNQFSGYSNNWKVDIALPIEYFDLSNNQFIGFMPTLWNSPELVHYDISNNRFDNLIQLFIRDKPHLRYLDLSNNILTGPMPDLFSNNNLNGLLYFNVANNNLNGSMPISTSRLLSVQTVDISGNLLCEPTDPTYTIWKQGVAQFISSNITCGQVAFADFEKPEWNYQYPLHSNEVNHPIAWFVFTKQGSSGTLNGLTFQTDRDITADVSNVRLYKWDQTYFDSNNTPQVTDAQITHSATEIFITNLNETVGNTISTYYYLVVDVSSEATFSTDSFTLSLPATGIQMAASTVADIPALTFPHFFEPEWAHHTRNQLNNFYYNSEGGSWTNNANWYTIAPLSTFYGVRVDEANDMIELRLPDNNIRYRDSFEETYNILRYLERVQVLDLSNNQLEGNLPSDFFTYFINLKEINLSDNPSLTVPFENLINESPSLRQLRLENTKLDSPVFPSSFAERTSLEVIVLPNYGFTGSLPEEVADFTNLRLLNVANNELTNIPDLSGLAQLDTLDVSGNRLTMTSLVPNAGIPNFQYQNQKAFGQKASFKAISGLATSFGFDIDADITDNQVQWFKEGTAVGSVQSSMQLSIPNVTTTLAGEYYCMVQNPALPGFTLQSDTLTLEVINFSITNSTAPATVDQGQALPISVTVNDASYLSKAQVFIKPFGSTSETYEESIPMTLSGNTFSVSVPASKFDALGLVYEIGFYDASNTLIVMSSELGDAGVFTTKINYAAGIDFTNLKAGNTVESYQLFSVPLKLDDDNVTSVFADLGPYDKSVWRIFSLSNGQPVEFGESGFTKIEVGKAYLLIMASPRSINTGSGSVPTLDNSGNVNINLSSGWNLVGNPFNQDISWNELINLEANASAKAAIQDVYDYNGGWIGNSSTLKVGGGFLVRSSSAVTLKINASLAGANNRVRSAQEGLALAENPDNWELIFSLHKGQAANFVGGIGMSSDAVIGEDRYDGALAPRLPVYIDMVHQSNASITLDKVPNQGNYAWNFSVFSNDKTSNKGEILWSKEAIAHLSQDLYLFHTLSGTVINMKEANSFSFPLSQSAQFTAVYGDEAYLQSIISPEAHDLMAPYPNPSSGQLYWPMSVRENGSADKAKVTLSIHSADGKLVHYQQLELNQGGNYQLPVDISQKVEQGLYLYELSLRLGDEVLNKRGKLVIE